MSDGQLALTLPRSGLKDFELADGEPVEASAPAAVLSPTPPPPTPPELDECNLFAEAERIAAQDASASTRRQYAAINRSFGWLARRAGLILERPGPAASCLRTGTRSSFHADLLIADGSVADGDRAIAVAEGDHSDLVVARLRADLRPPPVWVDAHGGAQVAALQEPAVVVARPLQVSR